jgi:hypothetical protein
MEFVWNEIQAEDIRQASVAAMQGTYTDMQIQAAAFTQEASQLAAEASALDSQPPIMKSVARTESRTDSDGNSYTYTFTVQVIDASAMAERAAAVAEMQARAGELNQAAAALNTAAQKLQSSIASTNTLFYKLHNMAAETDEYYAVRMAEIKSRIEAYIARIGDIRDSFGNKFTTSADGLVYFGSSSGSILNNPTSFATQWDIHQTILNLPASQITDAQFANAAWFFAQQTSLHGQQ